jgi:hypothetical protein
VNEKSKYIPLKKKVHMVGTQGAKKRYSPESHQKEKRRVSASATLVTLALQAAQRRWVSAYGGWKFHWRTAQLNAQSAGYSFQRNSH